MDCGGAVRGPPDRSMPRSAVHQKLAGAVRGPPKAVGTKAHGALIFGRMRSKRAQHILDLSQHV